MSQIPGAVSGADIGTILSALERGTVMVRFPARKRRPEKKLFCLKVDTFEVVQYPLSKGTRTVAEESIDIREIKEVREGISSKDFERLPDEAKKVDQYCCFVIYHGAEFRLTTLSVAALCRDECDAWVKALKHVTLAGNFASHLLTHRWLNKEFLALEPSGDSLTIGQIELKKYILRISSKALLNKARQLFTDFDYSRAGRMGVEDFFNLYHSTIHVKTIGERFYPFCADRQSLTFSEVQMFFREEQKDMRADDTVYLAGLIREYARVPNRTVRDPRLPSLLLPEFVNFLFSKQNSVFAEEYAQIYQDMDRPISHYWIASSHNTWVHLDCWEGPDGNPIIYHGRTLTSKIRFIDVIKTIKDHAFVTSEYPVILSIEQHCDIQQQRIMARQFKEVFGDALLTELVDVNAMKLPSPNALKRKIIIKHKKLDGTEETSGNIKPEEAGEEEGVTFNSDLCNSILNGLLFMQDPIDKNWAKHYFVLTEDKLYFTEQQEKEEDEGDKTETNTETLPSTEQHLKEKWFHGKLAGGRVAAEKLLTGLQGCQWSLPGTREYHIHWRLLMSFVRDGKYNHCRIQTKSEGGKTKFYLIEQTLFDSIYELIMHYKTNPLKSQTFEQVLAEPVPQQNSHLGKAWFHENLSRTEAEEMLKKVRMDGAFLIRPSEQNPKAGQKNYAISFRAEGKVKHCRIEVDGGQYSIGSAIFDSLTELVQYYEANPLYRRMRLKYAINEDLLKSLGEAESDDVYYHPIYYTFNEEKATPITCKALFDYTAVRPDELSFCKDAMVTNVEKHVGGWWKGDCGNKKQKWFPANHVEEVQLDEVTEDRQLGNLQQGAIDISGCTTEIHHLSSNNLYALKIVPVLKAECTEQEKENHVGLMVAAQSLEEILKWQKAIDEARNKANSHALAQMEKEKERKKDEQKKRIAIEMSDIIAYCRPVPFDENKSRCGLRVVDFRVYPKGQRLDSSNYDPVPMWNGGCQMVSLNYQTGDKFMQLNEGKFLQNGKCGYVLMADCMFDAGFNPLDISTQKTNPITLSVQIIGGRHLLRQGRGMTCPLVEVEVIGVEVDYNKYRTSTCKENGFNPVWNEGCDFDINNPSLALLRFTVLDEDAFGDANFLGQAVFPVQCLRTGYRSVPLKNAFSEELELCSLLVHLEMRSAVEEGEELYCTIRSLREDITRMSKQFQHMVRDDPTNGSDQLAEIIQEKQLQLRKLNSARQVVTQGGLLSRKHDFDHYLCTLLLPKEVQSAVFAIRAFNVETAQIRELVTEKATGKMRVQFWRDSIDAIYKKEPPKHPVAVTLATAVGRYKLSKLWFSRLLDSREANLSLSHYSSTRELEDYSENTFSSLLYLTLEAMGVRSVAADHACSHLGKAEGICTVLRAAAYHRTQRCVFVPMDIIMRHGASQESFIRAEETSNQSVHNAVYDFASLGHTHLLKLQTPRLIQVNSCDEMEHQCQ
eukprot:Em0018g1225a